MVLVSDMVLSIWELDPIESLMEEEVEPLPDVELLPLILELEESIALLPVPPDIPDPVLSAAGGGAETVESEVVVLVLVVSSWQAVSEISAIAKGRIRYFILNVLDSLNTFMPKLPISHLRRINVKDLLNWLRSGKNSCQNGNY